MIDSLSPATPQELLSCLEERFALLPESQRSFHFQYFSEHKARIVRDLQWIAQHAPQGTALLEIGGFPFHESLLLSSMGYSLSCVDLDPERAHTLTSGQGLNIVSCDIERECLPNKTSSAPVVLFCEVFEHLRWSPLHVLDEIYRVLEPGGLLYLTTPNLYALNRVVRFLLGRGFNDPVLEFMKIEQLGHAGHIREYSLSEIERFLSMKGFHILEHTFSHDVHFQHSPSISISRRYARQCIHLTARILPPLRNSLTVVARAEK